MNTKKMTAFIVGAMLIATVLVMAVSAAGMPRSNYVDMPRMVYEFDAVDATGIYVNYDHERDNVTVRVYGEEDAIYPTQSYTEALDFIYMDPVDPFDPGVIAKDSATFNPAYMYNAASVDDDDALEDDMKVFFRVFYEPGYDHVVDALMSTNYGANLEPVSMPEGALVTETTYMLVQNNGVGPLTGAVDNTRFKMAVNAVSSTDGTPGMDEDVDDSIVDLVYAEGDGPLGVDEPTDGTIEVAITYPDVAITGSKLRFMDHEVELTDLLECSNPPTARAVFDVEYIGNMNYLVSDPATITVDGDGVKYYLSRFNDAVKGTTDEGHRWFISVTNIECDNTCDVTLGRRLVAGETFYVDGIRYDMPAIYVNDDDMFKYITLQSPLPKCTENCNMWAATAWTPAGLVGAQIDESHVACQCLAKLCIDQPVWVLPPFNEGHTMIDDIGTVYPAGDIYGAVNALEFHYIKEDTEDRFDTSLAERHRIRKDGVEIWNWWSVFTKPYHYVELVLPNDEDEAGSYDGYEYLITTSFIAPNCEGEERVNLSKSSDEVHDIIDRVATIAVAGDDRRDAYADMPRMVFEFAGDDTDDVDGDGKGDGEDLFVNWFHHSEDPTVRIYGEEGAIYPTQSMTGALDFIYPDPVDPFDPGVIAKDSVTFNPAYIENRYGSNEITVDGANADEKIFLRAFYEPEYYHPIDAKMNNASSGTDSVYMENGALVVETTYMLLLDNGGSGHSGDPKAGAARDSDGNVITYFMMPTRSNNLFDGVAGMNRAQVLDLNWASGAGTPQLTDGEIEVQTRPFTLVEGQARNFMDHKIKFVRPTTGMEIKLDISYIGNMKLVEDRLRKDVEVNEDQKYYVDRLNNLHPSPDPDWRFYFEVVSMTYDATSDKYEANLIVGRRLVAGETFYVDGVRYDMPAIYVTDEDKFKYITFQTPLPKCEGEMWYGGPNVDERNQADKSHVTCQWLANILVKAHGEQGIINDIPVLPPFNEPHMMIDDIGLAKFNTGTATEPDWEICTEAGNIIEGEKDPLKFYYINELEEWRFDTSLAEIHAYNSSGSAEIWNWWSIFTKPYQYTELILPDQETPTYDASGALTGDRYVDRTCEPVDGNEYLITTSFIAPNCEGEQRVNLSKSSDEMHDIIDRASTLRDRPDEPLTCGDVTDDGNVNMGDVIMLFDHVANSGVPPVDASVADVTGDGNVNMGDVIMLFDHVANSGVPPLNCP
jgi:hypothetical protein